MKVLRFEVEMSEQSLAAYEAIRQLLGKPTVEEALLDILRPAIEAKGDRIRLLEIVSESP